MELDCDVVGRPRPGVATVRLWHGVAGDDQLFDVPDDLLVE